MAATGANRNDVIGFTPAFEHMTARGLTVDIESIHMDRSYDVGWIRDTCRKAGIDDIRCAKRRRHGDPSFGDGVSTADPLGMRWAIERTNSWLSNFGQLRRNTDRKTGHRLAQLALAITLIITAKLIDWRNRWSPSLIDRFVCKNASVPGDVGEHLGAEHQFVSVGLVDVTCFSGGRFAGAIELLAQRLDLAFQVGDLACWSSMTLWTPARLSPWSVISWMRARRSMSSWE
jgi:hypothetical protein